MGIGSTVKHILSPNDTLNNTDLQEGTNAQTLDRDTVNDPSRLTNSNRASKLPPGTGPGTSGKLTGAEAHVHPSEATMDQERARAQGNSNISGYGTDAAAAAGGSLSGTHQNSQRAYTKTDRPGDRSGVQRSTMAGGSSTDRGNAEYDRNIGISPGGHTGVLEGHHTHGHTKNNPKDNMPTGNAQEDTNQLNPVVHERVHHLETEEVSRVKDHDRHVHHIQHHIQPILASEELQEQYREQVHPVTHIRETHANKVEDNTLFQGQIRQHHDTLQHDAKERTIVDKGTVVNEKVHHHIHHVIQPIIEKETVDRQRIRTTIPIHEVTHEAPVVHQSQTHAPVAMEHFLQRGGTLEGAVSRDEIGQKILHGGQCTREVDGIAESLERELNIGNTVNQHTHIHSASSVGDDGLAQKKAAATAAHAQRGTTTAAEQPRTRD